MRQFAVTLFERTLVLDGETRALCSLAADGYEPELRPILTRRRVTVEEFEADMRQLNSPSTE